MLRIFRDDLTPKKNQKDNAKIKRSFAAARVIQAPSGTPLLSGFRLVFSILRFFFFFFFGRFYVVAFCCFFRPCFCPFRGVLWVPFCCASFFGVLFCCFRCSFVLCGFVWLRWWVVCCCSRSFSRCSCLSCFFLWLRPFGLRSSFGCVGFLCCGCSRLCLAFFSGCSLPCWPCSFSFLLRLFLRFRFRLLGFFGLRCWFRCALLCVASRFAFRSVLLGVRFSWWWLVVLRGCFAFLVFYCSGFVSGDVLTPSRGRFIF